MGHWDNLYYDIYFEIQALDMQQQFDALIQQLIINNKHTPIKELWQNALETIRQNG